jgi:uncharacterized membrane protein (DUF2068 family)
MRPTATSFWCRRHRRSWRQARKVQPDWLWRKLGRLRVGPRASSKKEAARGSRPEIERGLVGSVWRDRDAALAVGGWCVLDQGKRRLGGKRGRRARSRPFASRDNEVLGVRVVALFEGLKGVLVLVAGVGLLRLVHHDLQAIAERVVRLSHLNPARHYPRIFIDLASRTTDARLKLLAAMAFVYAMVRLVEAYGLWTTRVWAEWFAIVSGAAFLPLETLELWRRATWTRGAVLLINLALVAYLISVRLSRRETPSGD